MTFQLRRVVTGHDANGKSVIDTDEVMSAVSRNAGAGVTGVDAWSTNQMPVDNSAAAAEAQKKGYIDHSIPHMNYVDTGNGTVIRFIEWGPGNPPFTHRTATVDYIIMVSGEIDLVVDGEKAVTLNAGDVLIQRGGMHTWLNKSNAPAVMAAILIDALPVTIGDKVMNTHFPK